MSRIIKTSLPQIKAAWDNFWAGFEPIAKPVFEFLKSALKGFGTFASDTFSLVKNAFFGSSDDIRNSWKKLFDDMNDTLSNWATEMWEKIPRVLIPKASLIRAETGRYGFHCGPWPGACRQSVVARASGGAMNKLFPDKALPGQPGRPVNPTTRTAESPPDGGLVTSARRPPLRMEAISSGGAGAKGGPDPEMMKHIERVSAGNPELRKKLLVCTPANLCIYLAIMT